MEQNTVLASTKHTLLTLAQLQFEKHSIQHISYEANDKNKHFSWSLNIVELHNLVLCHLEFTVCTLVYAVEQ